ncbi:uncharacterized protein HD556DRAFT_1440766 [Suillus plorans]|uniref:Uncharacterized protein n=1 Tax=Suillus plorans TaxID=116603 RepID=A0A9P7IZZ0_9AGAM|nr:uncharacterized protein HD556DRAFT_1440766 [Suillus plorans]KAG1797805.1 hypothetical protein HD556DRAFT_1440766 [Suillus plorans]
MLATADQVDAILEAFDLIGISVSMFIIRLLTDQHFTHEKTVIDPRENSHRITELLQVTGESTFNVHKKSMIYQAPLAAKANSSHFSVSHTSVQQLEEFGIDVLSEGMQQHAPVTWDLLEVLLAARRKGISNPTVEDEDCDDEALLWEQLVILDKGQHNLHLPEIWSLAEVLLCAGSDDA